MLASTQVTPTPEKQTKHSYLTAGKQRCHTRNRFGNELTDSQLSSQKILFLPPIIPKANASCLQPSFLKHVQARYHSHESFCKKKKGPRSHSLCEIRTIFLCLLIWNSTWHRLPWQSAFQSFTWKNFDQILISCLLREDVKYSLWSTRTTGPFMHHLFPDHKHVTQCLHGRLISRMSLELSPLCSG